MSGALSTQPPHSGATVYHALPYAQTVLLEDIRLSSLLRLCLALWPLGKQQTPKNTWGKMRPGGHGWPDGQIVLARRSFTRKKK